MHAHIISDEPGSCPICGMDLEKVQVAGNSSQIEINVSGDMQQALALKVAPVERKNLWKYVKTVGQIDFDESQINHIHSRVSGWIEKLAVTAVGDNVTKGQLLYELYSPELISAQDDYLLAQSTYKASRNNADYSELVRKAAMRLELLGMTKQQIKQLSKSGKSYIECHSMPSMMVSLKNYLFVTVCIFSHKLNCSHWWIYPKSGLLPMYLKMSKAGSKSGCKQKSQYLQWI